MHRNIPNASDIVRVLHVVHIPKAIAKGMADQISGWLRSNGPEWTVKRLKALKTDYLQILGGNAPTSSWIRYTKGVPAGAFGRLFRIGLENQSDPKLQTRVLNALNLHTLFVSQKETKAQLDKFYSAVASQDRTGLAVEHIFGFCELLASNLEVDPETPIRTVKDYNPAQGKRAPSAEGNTVPEERWFETISVLWETSLGSNLWYNFSQLRTVCNPVEKVVVERLAERPSWLKAGREIQSQGFAGKIGHIQEPGFKLRAVANPFRIYQLALSRLGSQLYKLVRTLPWDCTHDQDEGTLWSAKKLAEGHTMFAVDLSNATDCFPYSLQRKVLSVIRGVNIEDIMLLDELVRAPWLSPTHGLVTWNKGQPLGLFPSFALFTLTHGILLKGLEQHLRKHDTFRVLGDDVVISDPEVHSLYRKVLDDLEIPVSLDKTLASDRITEFGGRVILPGSVISVGKWRRPSDRNFMDLVRNIGPRMINILQPRQRKVAEKVMTLPPPFGLSMNPKGLSAEKRWEIEEKLLFLYEPKYRLPHYEKTSWPRALMNTEFVSHLFGSTPLEGHWQQTRKDQGRPDPSQFVELHQRLKRTLGVTTLPSIQVDSLNKSYPDMLELAKRLAVVLDLTSPTPRGDPRGTSELQLWEERMKADKS